jgi:hypothetical protein
MDFKTHLEAAWHLTLKHIGALILMTLVMTLIGALTLTLLYPVMLAGYIQAILMMIRSGREPRIQDLFTQMHLFLPLLAFSIIMIIAVAIGFTMLYLPGIAVICGVVFAFLYTLPLMTDKRLGLGDALKQSWQLAVQGNIADHVVVVILVMGFLTIGYSVFLGFLFTQPLATVFLLLIYRERVSQHGLQDMGPGPGTH